jgi:acetyl-CoA acetyltransferase
VTRTFAGRYHGEKYGTTQEQFAKIAWKNHKHSVNNPYAQFQKEYTLDEVLLSKRIYDPLTMLQCSPTSDGAAAAILASEEFVKRNGLEGKAVEIAAQAMATDTKESYDDPMKLVGTDMTKRAAAEGLSSCIGVVYTLLCQAADPCVLRCVVSGSVQAVGVVSSGR